MFFGETGFSGLLPSILVLVALATRGNGISVCPTRSISSQAGEVTSPNHPSDYPSSTDCTLTITTEPGAKLNIVFKQMSVEEDQDVPEACNVDVLLITDGPQTRKYCTENMGPEALSRLGFKTTGNRITLQFKSDDEYEFEGFQITYTTDKPKPIPKEFNICPSRHIKRRLGGEFFSPNFPNNYPSNQRCRIRIHIPDNYQMNVWLTDFQLQKSPGCLRDKLIVKDDLGGMLMCDGRKNEKPPKLRALTATTAKIQFYSDASISKPGFHLHYNMTMLTKGQCLCSTGNSYIMIMNFFKKITRNQRTIKFSIKTTQSNGLIFFSKGVLRDYIYIGIENGKMFYNSDLGTGKNKAIVTGVSVNDDQWHNVVILRRKKTLMIDVDDGKAIATARTRGSFNKIDLPSSAGLALGAPRYMGLIDDFRGCIRDFTVDEIQPLANAYAGKPDYQFRGNKLNECR